MAGKTKSNTKKTQEAREEKEKLMARAVDAYKAELQKELPSSRKGLWMVCHEIEEEYRHATGKAVRLNHQTLANLVKGEKSLSQFNQEKGWLTMEEVNIVIEYALEVAARGFPLSHKRLKEHVDKICHARLGDAFPAGGVGENWTYHFVKKYSNSMKMCWSHPLESAHGNAVNPFTDAAWFDLLLKIFTELEVEEDCIWAADETGFQPGNGYRERVIGSAGTWHQHQQKGGSHENITMMVTICANGTTIPPVVIFKGQAYLSKWKQNNPINAL